MGDLYNREMDGLFSPPPTPVPPRREDPLREDDDEVGLRLLGCYEALFLALLVGLLAVVRCRDVPPPPMSSPLPPAPPAVAPPTPRDPEDRDFTRQGTIRSQGVPVPMFDTETRRPEGGNQIEERSTPLMLTDGTFVTVLGSEGRAVHIRVRSGPHRLRTGWVPMSSVTAPILETNPYSDNRRYGPGSR